MAFENQLLFEDWLLWKLPKTKHPNVPISSDSDTLKIFTLNVGSVASIYSVGNEKQTGDSNSKHLTFL